MMEGKCKCPVPHYKTISDELRIKQCIKCGKKVHY